MAQAEKRVTSGLLSVIPAIHLKEGRMAKPNYSFEKRQRELAKKKKKEEKLKEKAERKSEPFQVEEVQPQTEPDQQDAVSKPPAD
jgi:predicted Holliday junction resolvase-like endonuclease